MFVQKLEFGKYSLIVAYLICSFSREFAVDITWEVLVAPFNNRASWFLRKELKKTLSIWRCSK